jgi:hypothetical protein
MSPPDSTGSISLREYIDMRFASADKAVAAALSAQERAVASALVAAERAVLKAEAASEKRFESVNEFRAALSDNFRTLMPRAETERVLALITEKVDALVSRVNAREERSRAYSAGWGMLVGAVGIFSALAGIAFALTR